MGSGDPCFLASCPYVCVQKCVCMCVYVYMHMNVLCVYMCVHAYVCACVHAFVCARMLFLPRDLTEVKVCDF